MFIYGPWDITQSRNATMVATHKEARIKAIEVLNYYGSTCAVSIWDMDKQGTPAHMGTVRVANYQDMVNYLKQLGC